MPDYKELYHTLFRASEEAINLLIEAQRKCEELYMSQSESEQKMLSIIDSKNEIEQIDRIDIRK